MFLPDDAVRVAHSYAMANPITKRDARLRFDSHLRGNQDSL